MNYKNILARCNEIIKQNSKTNWIIIGDNSSGKSELLYNLVKELNGHVYYIDAVNRYINVEELALNKDAPHDLTADEIINRRIDKKYFNYCDSFGGAEHIERLYWAYSEWLCLMMNEFLGISFEIKQKDIDPVYGGITKKVYINKQQIELSSGYQAIFRIFAEVLFYCKILEGNGTIIIDEIDEFLSPRNSSDILMYLIRKFPMIRFVVSTHSADLVCNAVDCKMIVLGKNEYHLHDCNDFTTITDVNTLFQNVMGKEKSNNREIDVIDELLDKLLEMRLSRNWSEKEDVELQEIEEEKLTIIQKVIYNQIRSWR